MIGPPGSGKTMLARRIPTILPQMSFDEAIETAKIFRVSGMLEKERALLAVRPFRSPHHTIFDVGPVLPETNPACCSIREKKDPSSFLEGSRHC